MPSDEDEEPVDKNSTPEVRILYGFSKKMLKERNDPLAFLDNDKFIQMDPTRVEPMTGLSNASAMLYQLSYEAT